MPVTFQRRAADSAPFAIETKQQGAGGLSPAQAGSPFVAGRAMPARFEKLFGPDPIDLTNVCAEIRRTPGLEDVALRVLASLALAGDDSPHSLEEAAIALGTSRLKALFQGWVMLQSKESPNTLLPDGAPVSPILAAALETEDPAGKWTPELLYLAGFLRVLGLDSPQSLARFTQPGFIPAGSALDSYEGAADIFVRDFISLIPRLGVAAVIPGGSTIVASLSRSS